MTADRPSDNALQAAEIVVEQRHRDAAADLLAVYEGRSPGTCKRMRDGFIDKHDFVQAFARFERDHMPSTDSQAAKVTRVYSNLAALEKLVGFQVEGPCPICKGIEGCDHSLAERFRAATPSPVTDETVRSWVDQTGEHEDSCPVTDETALSGEAQQTLDALKRRNDIATENGCTVLLSVVQSRHIERVLRAALASTPQPAVAELIAKLAAIHDDPENAPPITANDLRIAAAIRQRQTAGEGR